MASRIATASRCGQALLHLYCSSLVPFLNFSFVRHNTLAAQVPIIGVFASVV